MDKKNKVMGTGINFVGNKKTGEMWVETENHSVTNDLNIGRDLNVGRDFNNNSTIDNVISDIKTVDQAKNFLTKFKLAFPMLF